MEFQAIIGIEIDGKTLDYCRETIQADNESAAKATAESMVRNAPKPPRGTLFVRRVENWN